MYNIYNYVMYMYFTCTYLCCTLLYVYSLHQHPNGLFEHEMFFVCYQYLFLFL